MTTIQRTILSWTPTVGYCQVDSSRNPKHWCRPDNRPDSPWEKRKYGESRKIWEMLIGSIITLEDNEQWSKTGLNLRDVKTVSRVSVYNRLPHNFPFLKKKRFMRPGGNKNLYGLICWRCCHWLMLDGYDIIKLWMILDNMNLPLGSTAAV